jgi:hypothetical protein
VTALDVSTTGLKSATSGALLHFTIGGHTPRPSDHRLPDSLVLTLP